MNSGIFDFANKVTPTSHECRVLFTANAARSQIAEALLRNLRPDTYEVHSAGTYPTGIDHRTLKALENWGIEATRLRSRSVGEFRSQRFDYVIALCDKAAAECQALPDAGELIAWDFTDPQQDGRQVAFGKTLDEICTRLQMFLLVT